MKTTAKPSRKAVPIPVWNHLQQAAKILAGVQDLLPTPSEAITKWLAMQTKIEATHRSAYPKYTPSFHSHVKGIPCGVLVTHYVPESPAIITSCPSTSHPPEGSEFECKLLRASGSQNKWLEAKATEADYERLFREYEEHLKELHTDY